MRLAGLFLMMIIPITTTIINAGCGMPKPTSFISRIEPNVGEINRQGTEDHPVLFVTSRSGIGKASIESSSSSWPTQLTIVINVQGLEHFEISSGTTKLNASLSSHQSDSPLRVWLNGQEDKPLQTNSNLWLDIQKDVNQKQITIQLPNAFLKQATSSIEFHWIDFYR